MRKFGCLMVLITALHAGCGDDDNDNRFRDAPVVVVETFTATLTTGAAVPVCAAAGASATGSATVVLSQDRSQVIVESLTFSGLSGPVRAIQIHDAAPGVAGPTIFDFGTTLTPPITRTFTVVDFPTPAPAGGPASFDAFVRDLEAGNAYIKIVTDECPAGEIRGQLVRANP